MSFYRIVIPYRVCRSREKILQRRGTINTMAYRGKIKHEYSCSSYWYSNMATVLKNLRNLDYVSILYITVLKSERERERERERCTNYFRKSSAGSRKQNG